MWECDPQDRESRYWCEQAERDRQMEIVQANLAYENEKARRAAEQYRDVVGYSRTTGDSKDGCVATLVIAAIILLFLCFTLAMLPAV